MEAAIIRIYGKTAGAILSEGIRGPVGAVSTLQRETIDDFGIDEKDLSQDPTVVHAVDQMIIDAVRLNASDIHIEPFPGELKIRFRIGRCSGRPAAASSTSTIGDYFACQDYGWNERCGAAPTAGWKNWSHGRKCGKPTDRFACFDGANGCHVTGGKPCLTDFRSTIDFIRAGRTWVNRG